MAISRHTDWNLMEELMESTHRILIVRHGQNEDNANGILNGHRDLPLTELGKDQGYRVGRKLQRERIARIYSSRLSRALETAHIIASQVNVPFGRIIILPKLIERDFGVLTGKPVADILNLPSDKVLQTDGVNYFLEAEDAEDFPTLYQRAGEVLADIQSRHTYGTTLLVCHGDIGKMIRANYHGWDWMTGLKTPYFDNTGVLELKTAGDVIE
jgi:broad specificity phosphatase PhoE